MVLGSTCTNTGIGSKKLPMITGNYGFADSLFFDIFIRGMSKLDKIVFAIRYFKLKQALRNIQFRSHIIGSLTRNKKNVYKLPLPIISSPNY
jgi:hypothetical protein